jgi:hypothetical protein
VAGMAGQAGGLGRGEKGDRPSLGSFRRRPQGGTMAGQAGPARSGNERQKIGGLESEEIRVNQGKSDRRRQGYGGQADFLTADPPTPGFGATSKRRLRSRKDSRTGCPRSGWRASQTQSESVRVKKINWEDGGGAVGRG